MLHVACETLQHPMMYGPQMHYQAMTGVPLPVRKLILNLNYYCKLSNM